MDVVGWYVLYQKYDHKDGIQDQNSCNIPAVVCYCIDNVSCDNRQDPGRGVLDDKKENMEKMHDKMDESNITKSDVDKLKNIKYVKDIKYTQREKWTDSSNVKEDENYGN